MLLNEPWPESPEPRMPTEADRGNAVGIGNFQWNNLSTGLSPEKETEELVRLSRSSDEFVNTCYCTVHSKMHLKFPTPRRTCGVSSWVRDTRWTMHSGCAQHRKHPEALRFL